MPTAESASWTVRRARIEDARAIAEIYNESVRNSAATFDTEPKSVADREDWLRRHGNRHAVLVAEKVGEPGGVVGWASLSEWSDRQAYSETAETSLYVESRFRGQRVGSQLMQALLQEARNAGFHTLAARIAGESAASIRLHEAFGFLRVGTLREVGFKFGRFHDVHLFQLLL